MAGAGRERAVGDLDLARMDAEFALEAQRPHPGARGCKRLRLPQVNEHRVQRRLQPRRPADTDHVVAHRQQFGLSQRPLAPDIQGVVAGAERQPFDTAGRAGDGQRRLLPFRGFDDRQQIDAAFGNARLPLALRQQPFGRRQLLDALDLRQNDAVEPGADHRLKIAVSIGCRQRIDPHIAQRTARRWARLQCRDDRRPRRCLFGDSDGVLQIQNHRIGPGVEHLGDLARLIAGREQHGAEWHGEASSMGGMTVWPS